MGRRTPDHLELSKPFFASSGKRADLSELLSARASGDIHSMHVSAEELAKKLLETQTQLLVMKQRESARLAEGLKQKVGLLPPEHQHLAEEQRPEHHHGFGDGSTKQPQASFGDFPRELVLNGVPSSGSGVSFELTPLPEDGTVPTNAIPPNGPLQGLQGPPLPSGMLTAAQQRLLSPNGPPMATTSAIGTLYPPGNVVDAAQAQPPPRSIHVPSKNPAFARLYATPTKHLRDHGLQAHEHSRGAHEQVASMQVVGKGGDGRGGSSSNGVEKTSRGGEPSAG